MISYNETIRMIEKYRKIEKEITEEKGECYLFALLQPDDSGNYFDIVVSADWFDKDKRNTVEYITDKLKKYLDSSEIISISKIVLLSSTEEFVRAVNEILLVNHGLMEWDNIVINNMYFRKVYIITSKTKEDLVNLHEYL